jgi:hypothetical protein
MRAPMLETVTVSTSSFSTSNRSPNSTAMSSSLMVRFSPLSICRSVTENFSGGSFCSTGGILILGSASFRKPSTCARMCVTTSSFTVSRAAFGSSILQALPCRHSSIL